MRFGNLYINIVAWPCAQVYYRNTLMMPNTRRFLVIFVIFGITVAFAAVVLLFPDDWFNSYKDDPALLEAEQARQQRELQKQLLVSPTELNVPEEQYNERVNQLSEEGDTITMGTNCAMDPLILKLKTGSELKLQNNDSVEHFIVFEDSNFFSVSANDTRSINITETFGKSDGIYRYRCGEREDSSNVGIMYIVSQ